VVFLNKQFGLMIEREKPALFARKREGNVPVKTAVRWWEVKKALAAGVKGKGGNKWLFEGKNAKKKKTPPPSPEKLAIEGGGKRKRGSQFNGGTLPTGGGLAIYVREKKCEVKRLLGPFRGVSRGGGKGKKTVRGCFGQKNAEQKPANCTGRRVRRNEET